MRRYLEAGRLNSPRGIKGEIRFDCWCDSLEFLEDVGTLYLDDEGKRPLKVKEYRLSVSTVTFIGYEDRTLAASLTGRTVYFDRNDIQLPEGVFFFDDIVGCPVFDANSGEELGRVSAVDEGASSYYYKITGGSKEYYVPNVDEFIASASPEKGVFLRNYGDLAVEAKR